MHFLFLSSLLASLATASPAADAADLSSRQSMAAPPAGSVLIHSAATSGNGCPQGTVSTTISQDRTVVTFGFDAFQAYIGPGTTAADRSKNCQIHLDLTYPGGFQYSIMKATYHGYARLDKGVTGKFYSTYYFSQDASNTRTATATISGTQFVNGAIYTKSDEADTSSTVWSPCGGEGILNANNRLALSSTSSSAAGEFSDDDATIRFEQQVYVQWRQCTPGRNTPSAGNENTQDLNIASSSFKIGG